MEGPITGPATEKRGRVRAAPNCDRSLLLGPVVVGAGRVRRDDKATRRYHFRGIGALRRIDLLEERVLFGLVLGDLVPGLQSLPENVLRRALDLDAVLLAQVLQGLGVQLVRDGLRAEGRLPGGRPD